jgi:hypothetical protein
LEGIRKGLSIRGGKPDKVLELAFQLSQPEKGKSLFSLFSFSPFRSAASRAGWGFQPL